MKQFNYRIEPADYKVDLDDLRAVRDSVFIIDQHISPKSEQDDIDSDCYHVIARDNSHHPIGTGRLSPKGQISQIGVLDEWRNQGVGQSLLRTLIERAQKQGLAEIILETPMNLNDFFQKLGFKATGDRFSLDSNEFQRMNMPLAPLAEKKRPLVKPREASVPTQQLDNLEAYIDPTIRLITQARRQICIYTRDLEHELYGAKDVVEAFKQFAINSHDGCVQIIVQDTVSTHGKTHALIDLAQRLPSSFQFRIPIELKDQQYSSAFLINDRDGYLFRLIAERYQGQWSPNLAARKRQIYEEFERIWQRCLPCTEFRALGI
ncbi:MAG: GNAT family N-acetyltransferase [Gammaproteobacteria bacterium HGW-Gammaproteobacteria-3]|jgi:predicted GNAT family N-acyltransferase|nr:MAG: GNAT family N-acetyltransferase [Gammaproteobacteria bacterium HGW-Gammaproteobacteria-3]